MNYTVKEVFLTVRDNPAIPARLDKLKGKLTSSEKVFRAFCDLNERDVEQFVALHLDTGNRVRAVHVVSTGLVNSSLVHPREVFRAAILNGAARLIVIHNHPSGDPQPSPEDIEITKRLVKASKIIGIRILDHLIVSQSRYYSFADEGTLEGGEDGN